MRKKLLAQNTASSLLYQITTIICGFVLPRLIIENYGSVVNGLVNSITQFLGLITYLDLGMSAVVQSALYKPLAEHDDRTVSKIISSSRRFFRKIAFALVVYVVLLIVIYPMLNGEDFDRLYIGTLILAISISSFAQYYFGISEQLLLSADQRIYIAYYLQIITLVVNTLTCAFLMKCGVSIQMVKLVTALIFLMRPIYYRYYVRNHYSIDTRIQYDEEPIKQKWNGLAQHIAAVVIGGTDTVVLTVFSTLENVSIYGVYYLVINGIDKLFISLTSGFQSLYGELWAKQELTELNKSFSRLIWGVHTGVVFFFGCTSCLIVQFVQVYTKGINDINYVVPTFAILITSAYAVYCLRLPYNLMVLAGNHYKQTQNSYVVATIINIIVSILTVKKYGLVGVAIGTLVSMVYQTIWMALYNSKNLVCWPLQYFIKQVVVDVISVSVPKILCGYLEMTTITYGGWFAMALKVALIWGGWIVMVNIWFYKDMLMSIVRRIR